MSNPDGKQTATFVDSVFSRFEALTNLERGGYKPRVYRLERMRRLLAAFDNPHLSLPTIHIAGSKGKGSTAAFIASILASAGSTAAGNTAAGPKVGLYTSPHVSDYRERITINGAFASDTALAQVGRRLMEFLDDQERSDLPTAELPTTFEMLTLFAFLVFAHAECDVCVVETGLGGRLDATNLVDPLCSVLTPIELEHTEYLGTTIGEIAFEKAGIIKPGKPVFVSREPPDAIAVFESTARERGCPLHYLPSEVVRLDAEVDSEGSSYSFVLRDGFSISGRCRLVGRAQVENAALAALCTHTLYPSMSAECIARGIERAWLPGRLEIFPGRPPIVVDGAHTPKSVERVVDTVLTIFGGIGVCLFGAVLGKDIAGMLAILGRECHEFVVSRPGTFKASAPEDIHERLEDMGHTSRFFESPDRALRAARASCPEHLPVLVVGSFYLAAEVRKIVMEGGDEKTPR